MVGAMARRRLQITQPSPAAAISNNVASVHTGHWLSSTKLPLAKTVGGYLKRNSNIESRRSQHIMPLTVRCPSERLRLQKRSGKLEFIRQNAEFRSQNSEFRMAQGASVRRFWILTSGF